MTRESPRSSAKIRGRSLESAADAERHAEQLRADLAETLDSLAGNLVPSRLASEVAAAARDHSPDWLRGVGRLAVSPIGLGLIGAAAASVALGLIAGRRR